MSKPTAAQRLEGERERKNRRIARLQARVAELEAGVGQIESLHWELSRAVGREGCVSQSHCENWPCPTHKIVMRLLLPEDLA